MLLLAEVDGTMLGISIVGAVLVLMQIGSMVWRRHGDPPDVGVQAALNSVEDSVREVKEAMGDLAREVKLDVREVTGALSAVEQKLAAYNERLQAHILERTLSEQRIHDRMSRLEDSVRDGVAPKLLVMEEKVRALESDAHRSDDVNHANPNHPSP